MLAMITTLAPCLLKCIKWVEEEIKCMPATATFDAKVQYFRAVLTLHNVPSC